MAENRTLTADDRTTADDFIAQASQGAMFIWRGDFHNAKQLLQAVARRIDKKAAKKDWAGLSMAEKFNQHRQTQSHKARLLSHLLIELDSDLKINLPRAPDVSTAIREAITNPDIAMISLRDLLGMIGAHEWRKKGVPVAVLGDKIHPHYGLFSPVRGEYLDLIAQAPIPAGAEIAFDIGTGTGVIAAILARRKIRKVVGTDFDPRALACAKENLERLNLINHIALINCDLFPEGKADLIVCNPPWLPARPTSQLERAIYDEDSRMLKGFLSEVGAHLMPKGEAWLIMSDLAEHLGLRTSDELENLIKNAKLKVVDTLSTRPRHSKSQDTEDPLFEARSKEVTRLFRLITA